MLFTRSSPLAGGAVPLTISSHDRPILQRLAGRVANLAARPVEDEKRRLWVAHNALQPTRPLIFCDPENGWNEIFPPESLECEGELARLWEMRLRKEVFWGAEMGDDRVIEPAFDVEHVYASSGWGLDAEQVGGEHGGAYTWNSPVQSVEDVARLHAPAIEIDQEATARVLELAEQAFAGCLAVRLCTRWWWSMGLTWNMTGLRGLAQLMYDMVDQPEIIHAMMARLCDGAAATVDGLEQRGLISPNWDGSYVGSGGFGWTTELPQAGFDGTVRCRDLWGFAESQETVGISPAMFEEFVFPYQARLLERFGLNCYGCCEPLDSRWHIVKRFPRLRRVSVSPWANRPFMAEMLGDEYVYSMKPNPALLAMPTFDEDEVRADLRRDLQATRDCRVEVIMKDNHTIGRDPRRVVRWVQTAREEAERL